MEIKDGHVEVEESEASAGAKNQGVRYVLAISLLLAVVVLSLAWMLGAIAV